jgi:hypothetical protein
MMEYILLNQVKVNKSCLHIMMYGNLP